MAFAASIATGALRGALTAALTNPDDDPNSTTQAGLAASFASKCNTINTSMGQPTKNNIQESYWKNKTHSESRTEMLNMMMRHLKVRAKFQNETEPEEQQQAMIDNCQKHLGSAQSIIDLTTNTSVLSGLGVSDSDQATAKTETDDLASLTRFFRYFCTAPPTAAIASKTETPTMAMQCEYEMFAPIVSATMSANADPDGAAIMAADDDVDTARDLYGSLLAGGSNPFTTIQLNAVQGPLTVINDSGRFQYDHLPYVGSCAFIAPATSNFAGKNVKLPHKAKMFCVPQYGVPGDQYLNTVVDTDLNDVMVMYNGKQTANGTDLSVMSMSGVCVVAEFPKLAFPLPDSINAVGNIVSVGPFFWKRRGGCQGQSADATITPAEAGRTLYRGWSGLRSACVSSGNTTLIAFVWPDPSTRTDGTNYIYQNANSFYKTSFSAINPIVGQFGITAVDLRTIGIQETTSNMSVNTLSSLRTGVLAPLSGINRTIEDGVAKYTWTDGEEPWGMYEWMGGRTQGENSDTKTWARGKRTIYAVLDTIQPPARLWEAMKAALDKSKHDAVLPKDSWGFFNSDYLAGADTKKTRTEIAEYMVDWISVNGALITAAMSNLN